MATKLHTDRKICLTPILPIPAKPNISLWDLILPKTMLAAFSIDDFWVNPNTLCQTEPSILDKLASFYPKRPRASILSYTSRTLLPHLWLISTLTISSRLPKRQRKSLLNLWCFRLRTAKSFVCLRHPSPILFVNSEQVLRSWIFRSSPLNSDFYVNISLSYIIKLIKSNLNS